MDGSLHKGSSGRIAVVGGSKLYTGAPYYAAMGALRTGAELCSVFTVPEASQAIKSYSPELMVSACSLKTPVSDMPLMSFLKTMHVVILGNGYGSDVEDLETLDKIIHEIRAKGLPMVIDADGVKAVLVDPSTIRGYRKCILTPNQREFELLLENLGIPRPSRSSPEECRHALEQLANALEGVTVCLKGRTDVISDGTTTTECTVPGGFKRVGGLGDVLAGVVGLLVAWWHLRRGGKKSNDCNDDNDEDIPLPEVVKLGCSLVRDATNRAYNQHFRALTCPDVLTALPLVLPRPSKL